MREKFTPYEESVKKLAKENQLQQLKPMTPIDGAFILFEDQKYLSFCSHDYLSMADHPEIKKNAIKYLLQHGITASSELQDFYLSCQKDLEQKLSELLKRESILFFSSRYETNITALETLGHSNSYFFIDEKSHSSLFHGAQRSKGKFSSYHNLEELENLLKKEAKSKLIITESIFSSTGEIANLPRLIELAEQYQAILYVDDSHAFGITGVEGMGLCSHLRQIDMISGSLSKACGAYGGYLSSSKMLRDYLINHAPIKTQYFLPPPIIGAVEAVLEIIPTLEGERKQLEQRSHWLRNALRDIGFSLPKSNTPLISIPFQSIEEIHLLKENLKKEEILIGPPHSSKGPPRLNLALNICHMPDHLAQLIDSLKKCFLGSPYGQ